MATFLQIFLLHVEKRLCNYLCFFCLCSKLFFPPQLWSSMCTFYIAWNFSSFFIYKLLKNMCVFITIWIFVGPLQIRGNCCECWFFKYSIMVMGGGHWSTILFPDRFSGRNTQKTTSVEGNTGRYTNNNTIFVMTLSFADKICCPSVWDKRS